SLGFFIAGGVLALIMRTQLAADGGVVSQGVYDQLFTMHGSTMIYLFVVPISLAVGLYLVPLQVGAAELVAPRVALAGTVLFAVPALIVALALLWAQRHFGGVLVGDLGAVDYQQLFWFYGHPVVYVMFFPFVGMVGEVLATFSSKRFFGYSAFIVAVLAFSGLSMTVWAHHMFTIGQVTNKYF